MRSLERKNSTEEDVILSFGQDTDELLDYFYEAKEIKDPDIYYIPE